MSNLVFYFIFLNNMMWNIFWQYLDVMILFNQFQKVSLKREAFDEIEKVLEVVCEDHDLPFAQAWALDKGDIFHVMRNFNKPGCFIMFSQVNMVCDLRKWQGVVGRAFSSPNVLFCKDVTQLSISDYPLAHYAQYDKLGCCFAICLQSS
ncbi:hypothetical protein ACSBR2_038239 [Camellia fascicularis]